MAQTFIEQIFGFHGKSPDTFAQKLQTFVR